MAEELSAAPPRLTPLPGLDPGALPMAAALGLEPDYCLVCKRGGEPRA